MQLYDPHVTDTCMLRALALYMWQRQVCNAKCPLSQKPKCQMLGVPKRQMLNVRRKCARWLSGYITTIVFFYENSFLSFFIYLEINLIVIFFLIRVFEELF